MTFRRFDSMGCPVEQVVGQVGQGSRRCDVLAGGRHVRIIGIPACPNPAGFLRCP
jgi:hypothetical protein